jgi:hypothetical protein
MSKGDFLLHLGPEAHERLRLASEKEGVSMAQLLKEGLELRLSAGQPSPRALMAALRLVERAARQLADGPDLAVSDPFQDPSAEHKQDDWDRLMSDG